MINRRRFLKSLGYAGSGLILTAIGLPGCNGGGGGGGDGDDDGNGGESPNGYNFHIIKKSGELLIDGHEIKSFPGAVEINDRNQIVFLAELSDGRMGVYGIDLSSGDPRADIQREWVVYRQGDTVPGNLEVEQVGAFSLNNNGEVAIILNRRNEYQGIYLSNSEQVIEAKSALNHLGLYLSNSFFSVDIDDGDNILFVTHFADEANKTVREGLLYLPQSFPSQARLLLATGQAVAGGGEVVNSLGLVDLSDNQGVIAQVETLPADLFYENPDDRAAAQIFLRGDTATEAANWWVAAAGQGFTGDTSLAAANATELADLSIMPRLSGDTQAFVVNTSGSNYSLYVNDAVVASTGDKSPSGNDFQAFASPVVTAAGQVFFEALATDRLELLRTSGGSPSLIFRTPNPLDDLQVGSMFFGGMPNSANANEAVVVIFDLNDGGQALCVGFPV